MGRVVEELSPAEGSQVIAGGWIAAEGYVTKAFTSTLAGKDDAAQMLGLSVPVPERGEFSSIEKAQAAVDFRIFALSPRLSSSTLDRVQIERCCGKEMASTSVEQQVKLPDGHWIVLTQR